MSNRILVYTVAFDLGGNYYSRVLAKMLVLSLLKTMSNVDVFVFHNSPAPLFLLPLANVVEYPFSGPQPEGRNTADYYRDCASWRYLARNFLDVENYDWVLYLDADCLVLHSIDRWFSEFALSGKDVIVVPEYGKASTLPQFSPIDTALPKTTLVHPLGFNAGTFAVRASMFFQFLTDWENNAKLLEYSAAPSDRKWADQIAFNSVLGKKYRRFLVPKRQVSFAFDRDATWADIRKSILVHAVGGTLEEKCKYIFGLYMESFYFDSTGLFLEILNP